METLNVALGATPGNARLHLYSGHRMNSLLRLAQDPANPMAGGFEEKGSVTVPVATVDDVPSVGSHVTRTISCCSTSCCPTCLATTYAGA